MMLNYALENVSPKALSVEYRGKMLALLQQQGEAGELSQLSSEDINV